MLHYQSVAVAVRAATVYSRPRTITPRSPLQKALRLPSGFWETRVSVTYRSHLVVMKPIPASPSWRISLYFYHLQYLAQAGTEVLCFLRNTLPSRIWCRISSRFFRNHTYLLCVGAPTTNTHWFCPSVGPRVGGELITPKPKQIFQ